MVGRLLVITGASGVGKSTLSARIAASLEFDKVVATDTIRETLRTQISQNENPALHRSSFQPGESNAIEDWKDTTTPCLLYTSPSPRDVEESRMPSSA